MAIKGNWKARVAYINKEMGKVEAAGTKLAKKSKKPWQPSFWKKVKAQKKSQDSIADMVFGELDRDYKAYTYGPPEKREAALQSFARSLGSARRCAKAHVAQMKAAMAAAPTKEMSDSEKKMHDRDMKRLADILDKDLDVLITVAEGIFQELERKQALADRDEMAVARDVKNRMNKLSSVIKQSLTIIAKIERKPDAEYFNANIREASRIVLVQIEAIERFMALSNRDKTVMRAAHGPLMKFGGSGRQLTGQDAYGDKVIAEVGKVKKAVRLLHSWQKTVQV